MWAGSSVVEHSTFNRMVVSSNLTRPTNAPCQRLNAGKLRRATTTLWRANFGLISDEGSRRRRERAFPPQRPLTATVLSVRLGPMRGRIFLGLSLAGLVLG